MSDMVIANRHGGEHAARAAELGPAQTLTTGEQLAVVHMRGVTEVQRNGDVRLADHEPVHTVRAGGQHHGLLVLRNSGGPRPDLRLRPPAWCPSCERLVDGVQTWKRPDRRPWGRYGAQYFYTCPTCNGPALPGAFPAASIIDDSLPAPAIGERARPLAAKTRERIRRGLERLAREPFAIRLTHGGAPRPLTLPLVTLTQRHDAAVVIPVAGNTHERTAGNRARRAAERPLGTVHGTLDRALIVPPMGGAAPRPAATAPAPTQTTTTRAAIVRPPAEDVA